MQWDSSKNAGFTTGTPWLKVPDNYTTINTQNETISKQIRDYYKQLIQLRKDHKIIQEGSYEPFELGHESVYAYIRELDDQKLLVMNHFYSEEALMDIPKALLDMKAEFLIGNKGERKLESLFKLDPYETVAFLLKK